jgi:RNA polymerase sigma factor (sigma-70 family)
VAAQNEPVGPRPLRAVPDDGYTDWNAVYQDNAAWVYRTLFARVGNRADAEDLTAEVFLAALRPLRLTASVGEVRAYLLATARSVLAGHWRRTFGQQLTTIDGDRFEDVLSEAPVNDAAAVRADRILAALPDRYRRILQLRFLEACTVKEAAEEMGITVGNAKVLQHRALREAAAVNERLAP